MVHKPSSNHPWRQYKDRGDLEDFNTKKDQKDLKTFLTEMVESWDEFKIPSDGFELTKNIKGMKDKKIALWLASFLKRIYTS